jgi:two-component sensor histidine kinase
MVNILNINKKIRLLIPLLLVLALPLHAIATDSILIWKIQKFSNQHIQNISQDQAGFIQISTPKEIFKFDGRKFIKYKIPDDQQYSFILNGSRKKVYTDKNSYIWKISHQGIISVHLSTDEFITKNKLARETSDSVIIYHIFEDNHRFIWIASNIGLFRVHLRGTPSSPPPSKLVFTRFSTFSLNTGRLFHRTNQINNTQLITITKKRKFLEVEFSYPTFLPKNMPIYYYRLGDSNEKWIPLGTTNIITFHTMKQGKQQLWVKAEIPGPPKQEYIISKEIHTQAFLWETPYFFLPSILILLLIFLLIPYQRNQYLKKHQKFRTRISYDLHDEIGSTLTQISLSTDLLTLDILNPKEQGEMLRKISNLSRSIMSTINDVIWFQQEENSNIHSLIDHMKEEGVQLLSSANIQFSLNTYDLEGKVELPPNYSRNIYLIFKEALNNVVKHSNATHVNVYLSKKNKKYLLRINDNGTLSTGSIKKGQGLTNMVLRAEKINGTISIKKENGYTIELEVPVS